VGNALGADRVLGQPEGDEHRVLAVPRKQFVETIDITDPDAGRSMCQIGQGFDR
jgi:hypothetical protein